MHDLIADDLAERPAARGRAGAPRRLRGSRPGQRRRGGAASPTAPRWPDVPTVNLMGNHEHMMLAALATGEADATELWLANGGANSLLSWGVPRSAQPKEWAILPAQAASDVPARPGGAP